MTTSETAHDWPDDHFVRTAEEQGASWRVALRLTILCILLAAGSIAVTLIPG
jgi:hypothetical protein